MRSQLVVAAAVLALLMTPSLRADYIGAVKSGNKAFQEKDYKKAMEFYRQAEPDLPVSPELDYNMGGALHGEGDYDDAIKKFQTALKSSDPNLQAKADYNLGNTYYRKKDYQNAIQAYEDALKLNPGDMDGKFNLELARKMLKDQIKPQNQQQQNQQNKQDQKQDQQNQQNQQQNQKDQQKNKDQREQNNQNQQQDQQKQQNQANQSKKMSKEDAERILNALKDDEQNIQKKIRRENAKGDYVGKDW